jgi:membrane dipeptidase
LVEHPKWKKAEELHRSAIVIDGHCDILIPIAEGKMRLAERVEVPDPDVWQAPPGLEEHPLVNFGFQPHTIYFGCMGQYDIPRFIDGGLTAQVCAIYLDDDKLDDPLRYGLDMAWHLHRETVENEAVELVRRAADIRSAKDSGQCGLILGFEGLETLGEDVHLLEVFHLLGLRVASLTHTRRNLYADGCYVTEDPGGLTDLGFQAIRRMNELGIVIDLVHIGEIGFWEIMDATSAPLILSHSTPTMFPNSDPSVTGPFSGIVPRPRIEKPRDRKVLEAIAENGGVLGITWVCHADLEDVVTDIETSLEVMGEDHIGLGSDLYGVEAAPKGLEDISKVPAITRALVDRGHSNELILKFLGGNYLRVFEQVWG